MILGTRDIWSHFRSGTNTHISNPDEFARVQALVWTTSGMKHSWGDD